MNVVPIRQVHTTPVSPSESCMVDMLDHASDLDVDAISNGLQERTPPRRKRPGRIDLSAPQAQCRERHGNGPRPGGLLHTQTAPIAIPQREVQQRPATPLTGRPTDEKGFFPYTPHSASSRGTSHSFSSSPISSRAIAGPGVLSLSPDCLSLSPQQGIDPLSPSNCLMPASPARNSLQARATSSPATSPASARNFLVHSSQDPRIASPAGQTSSRESLVDFLTPGQVDVSTPAQKSSTGTTPAIKPKDRLHNSPNRERPHTAPCRNRPRTPLSPSHSSISRPRLNLSNLPRFHPLKFRHSSSTSPADSNRRGLGHELQCYQRQIVENTARAAALASQRMRPLSPSLTPMLSPGGQMTPLQLEAQIDYILAGSARSTASELQRPDRPMDSPMVSPAGGA